MALIKCPECGHEVSDKAEKCIHCGYPLQENIESKIPAAAETPTDHVDIDQPEAEHTTAETESSSKQAEPSDVETDNTSAHSTLSNNKSKRIIPIIAIAIAVLAVGVGIYWKQVIEPRTQYEHALAISEDGLYQEADSILADLGDYEDAIEIREELRYESYGYAALTAIYEDSGAMPEELSVDDIHFYSGKNASKSADETESTAESDDDDPLIDEDHPYIIVRIASNVGGISSLGGKDTAYVTFAYDKNSEQYDIDGFTNTNSFDDLLEEYPSADENYWTFLLGAAMVQSYEENGIEVGGVDMARFQNVVDSGAYVNIEMLQE